MFPRLEAPPVPAGGEADLGLDGREVHAKLDVAPFEAVAAGEEHLPARFRETRHPQVRRDLSVRCTRRRRRVAR
jgi:hypothetical protein